MCGALRASDSGNKAVVMGWVNRRRDHGNLLFVDLRDRTGVTQVVINAERNAALHEKSAALRNEYVIAVVGTVKLRDANTINPNMPTGEVELVAEELRILNETKLPPFLPSDTALTNEAPPPKNRSTACTGPSCSSTSNCATKSRKPSATIYRRKDFSRSKPLS